VEPFRFVYGTLRFRRTYFGKRRSTQVNFQIFVMYRDPANF